MIHYKELYHKLFAAAADTLDALNDMNIGQAKEILLKAQLEAEEVHMEEPTGILCDYLEKL